LSFVDRSLQRINPDWRRLPWRARYAGAARAASEVRRLSALLTHLHADVRFDGPVYLGPGFALRIPEGGTFRVGAGVDIRRNFVCEISGTGRVIIGDGCVFTGLAMIQCSTSVDFGEGAILGQGCLVADGSHRFRDASTPVLEQGYDFRPITIGRGALIHTNCTIINDVGERAVIGANSVVTRPIPPFCLAYGTPAKVVEYFGPAEDLPRPQGP
jgi:acetyltransferase-like isoleucine patch superfamily enzyme